MNWKIMSGLVLCCLCGTALAEGSEDISALVETTGVRQMEMYSRVSGFGTVVPEPGGALNLNFPKAGEVTRLLVTPGQQVKRGSTMLEITTAPSDTLAYNQAENAVAYSRGELSRVKSLYDQQLATLSQVGAATKALKDAEDALGALRNSRVGIRRDRLTAPFNGTVVSVSVASGDRFPAGANLAQLARNGFMEARLGIEPEDSRQIAPGMKVRLAAVFNPQDVVEGKVRQVTGQIDPQTQLVNVQVRFKGNIFLPGTRVRGDIAISGHEAQAVPRQAVLRDDEGAYLFQVIDGKAHRVTVKTGLDDGNWTEVVSPKLPDLPVVTLGNYELEDNMAVREAKQ
jgi:RND family efflux transporter MFP subunit